MKYILILLMFESWGGGGAAATFANKASCEAAGEATQSATLFNGEPSYRPWKRQYICVPYDITKLKTNDR